jgi:hypothetical protein
VKQQHSEEQSDMDLGGLLDDWLKVAVQEEYNREAHLDAEGEDDSPE